MNKKTNFVLVLMMVVPIVAFAQLKVKSNGSVIAKNESFANSNWITGLQSGLSISNGKYSAALYGDANNTVSSGMAYGVIGVAKNANTGSNFGVHGVLGNSSQKGAGIFGSTVQILNYGFGINGTYAGYFNGATRVEGTLTATSIVQSSDLRLKENIVPLSSRRESILDKVLDMNVIEYSYKKIIPSMILPDTVPVDDVMQKAGITPGKKHIGLIAQELRVLFPTLVEEQQDGYLAINYIELVPILIQAIQELKEELDGVKGTDIERTRSASSYNNIIKPASEKNVLYQNNPNPFKEQTIIRFSLADDVQDAAICIFDMTGKTIKKMSVSSGMESVSIGGYELGEGMFLYSLIVNGQEIDTKKMIISK